MSTGINPDWKPLRQETSLANKYRPGVLRDLIGQDKLAMQMYLELQGNMQNRFEQIIENFRPHLESLGVDILQTKTNVIGPARKVERYSKHPTAVGRRMEGDRHFALSVKNLQEELKDLYESLPDFPGWDNKETAHKGALETATALMEILSLIITKAEDKTCKIGMWDHTWQDYRLAE